ncbi:MAG: sugar phosphate isomerase/epimerase [Clostridiales bacterium]|nr:sugar phosphate isomerase/epimerase [Clostridiales bacterium]
MPVKAIQQFMLGTVMNKEAQARETLRLLNESGYQGIELCGFMIHPTGMMVRMLTKAAGMPTGNGGKLDWPMLISESGLQVVSLHTDLGSLERDLTAIVKDCKSFGTKYAVITGMYRFAYNDKAAVKDLAARLNKAGEELAKQGIQLLYHNHNCELLRVEGSTRAFDILLDDTDSRYVNFEFDSYWYTEGGADAGKMMKRMGQRMKLWHINDRGTKQTGPAMTPILKSDSMELGTGNMDLERLTELALINGIDAVILESHRNWIDKSPIKSFQTSAKFLNEHFK